MQDLNYGKGYLYAHDFKEGYVPQNYLPKELRGELYYHPTERGYEKLIKQRLTAWYELKKKSKKA
jgi:putative ATPase